MILSSIALVMSLQGAAESASVVKNDDPETWTVEYPRIIRPFVVNYRSCLNGSDRRVTGEPNFEAQHRTDIPRCAKARNEAITASITEMAGAKSKLSQQELDTLFTNIGLIHVARGRDLDDQFKQRIAAAEAARSRYEDEKPKGLVLELQDASVVKARVEEIQASESKSVE